MLSLPSLNSDRSKSCRKVIFLLSCHPFSINTSYWDSASLTTIIASSVPPEKCGKDPASLTSNLSCKHFTNVYLAFQFLVLVFHLRTLLVPATTQSCQEQRVGLLISTSDLWGGPQAWAGDSGLGHLYGSVLWPSWLRGEGEIPSHWHPACLLLQLFFQYVQNLVSPQQRPSLCRQRQLTGAACISWRRSRARTADCSVCPSQQDSFCHRLINAASLLIPKRRLG